MTHLLFGSHKRVQPGQANTQHGQDVQRDGPSQMPHEHSLKLIIPPNCRLLSQAIDSFETRECQHERSVASMKMLRGGKVLYLSALSASSLTSKGSRCLTQERAAHHRSRHRIGLRACEELSSMRFGFEKNHTNLLKVLRRSS
jgi:hypothetical protein